MRYDLMINAAFLSLVRDVLRQTEKLGLPKKHCFVMTFDTTSPGVELSKNLRAQYPKKLTIQLQHQFEDLHVTEDAFAVSLFFSGRKERITVPFGALTVFEDPYASFKLCFCMVEPQTPQKNPKTPKTPKTTTKTIADVVQLDAFRNPPGSS